LFSNSLFRVGCAFFAPVEFLSNRSPFAAFPPVRRMLSKGLYLLPPHPVPPPLTFQTPRTPSGIRFNTGFDLTSARFRLVFTSPFFPEKHYFVVIVVAPIPPTLLLGCGFFKSSLSLVRLQRRFRASWTLRALPNGGAPPSSPYGHPSRTLLFLFSPQNQVASPFFLRSPLFFLLFSLSPRGKGSHPVK